nr:glycosyltransferase family 4 protein [Silicimonas algicola]
MIESTGGGSVRHVMDLFDALLARGHDVRLIASLARSEPQFLDWLARVPPGRFIRIDMRREPHPSDLRVAMRLRSLLGPNTRDRILHAHSSKAGLIAQTLRRRYRATLFTPHAFRGMDRSLSRTKGRVMRCVDHWLGRPHDRIIAVSPEELDYARDIGLAKDRLRYVPNGIDLDAIAGTAGQPRPRGDGRLRVGFVGRLVHQKNPMAFIEAFALARLQRDDIQAVVIGAGPLEADLKSYIAAHGLEDSVSLLGQVNFVEHMRDMDLQVHTSRYESLPYVLLEACAVGMPIVAVRNAGTETVFGRDADLVEDCTDAKAIATSLLHLMSSKDRMCASGQRSRSAGSRFSIGTMVDEIETLYREAGLGHGDHGLPMPLRDLARI